MPQFDPNFVSAYLADNESSDSKNMTEFEKADGFEQINEKNMANYEDQSTEKNLASFEAAAEEWDAVAEAKLLNEINLKHTSGCFGKDIFSTRDKMVQRDDFEKFVKYLIFCR